MSALPIVNLAQNLSHYTSLATIDLPSELICFYTYLRLYLYLPENAIGNDGIKELAPEIFKLKTLKTLNISCLIFCLIINYTNFLIQLYQANQIGEAGATVIAIELKKNKANVKMDDFNISGDNIL